MSGWLRDESLEDSANLPEPDLLVQEIADDRRSALAQIEDVLGDLEQRVAVTMDIMRKALDRRASHAYGATDVWPKRPC